MVKMLILVLVSGCRSVDRILVSEKSRGFLMVNVVNGFVCCVFFGMLWWV